MAWLEQHPTSGRFKICFRWGGHQFKKTVKTTNRSDAEAILVRLKENIGLIERGRLQIPPETDIATFLLSDGKMTQTPKIEPQPKPLTLEELRDLYVDALSHGTLEADSRQTVKMHLKHFVMTFGVQFPIAKLTLEDLQRHVERRARKKYRGLPLSPIMLRKEMASFRACLNWGVQSSKLRGAFPNRGLKYPKANEKPPFQTWEEIERQIARGGLTLAGKVYVLVRPESLNGLHTIAFLQHLARHAGKRLLVIWDGSPIHRREEVSQFLSSPVGQRMHVERLPGYAPDLNPWDTGGWDHLKHVELRNIACLDLEELHLQLHLAIGRLRKKHT